MKECATSYDNVEIEFALIDILYRRSMGYILQDLKCLKCNEIQRDNVSEHCTCSGKFTTTINRNEIVQCVKILQSISNKCRMNVLADVISSTRLLDTAPANST